MKLNLGKSVNVLLFLYFIILMILSFLGIIPLRSEGYLEVSHNLIPFDTIRTYLLNFHKYNFDIWFFNTFGVVLLFMPLGFLLPRAFMNVKCLRNVILISIVISTFIESMQYLTNLGVFDIDDIILDTLGALLGYLFLKFYKQLKTSFS